MIGNLSTNNFNDQSQPRLKSWAKALPQQSLILKLSSRRLLLLTVLFPCPRASPSADLPNPNVLLLSLHPTMADDKKRDDFTIDMNERNGKPYDSPSSPRHVPQAAAPLAAVANNPVLPILSYCTSSILMTVTNKFVLSGFGFNLNFFLLCVQVCSPSAERLDDMVLM